MDLSVGADQASVAVTGMGAMAPLLYLRDAVTSHAPKE
ncbi:hypothetical protein BIWAKO_06981 [Bosea sp. BIWAKO-01]|nr:hypothetical protein BIWAKO_06981 [Bosea sp. BIWAKO-01]